MDTGFVLGQIIKGLMFGVITAGAIHLIFKKGYAFNWYTIAGLVLGYFLEERVWWLAMRIFTGDNYTKLMINYDEYNGAYNLLLGLLFLGVLGGLYWQRESQSKKRTCPYCAETIRAEAVVCRYCGKDLQERGQDPLISSPAE